MAARSNVSPLRSRQDTKPVSVECVTTPTNNITPDSEHLEASQRYSLALQAGFGKNSVSRPVNGRNDKISGGWAKQDLNDRLLEAANGAPLALITIDSNGLILAANSSCKSIVGIPATVLAGTVFFDYLSTESVEILRKTLNSSVDGSKISGNELSICLCHPLISTRSMQALTTRSHLSPDGKNIFIIVLLDRSRQRLVEKQLRNSKDYLERLATHDALTGLPNRIYFTDALRAAMLNSRKSKRELALLYFDIDGFKAVNDQCGHHVGDGLLREIANRLRARTIDVGRLARLGGDEFTMIIEHSGTYDSLFEEAEKVRIAINEPVHTASKTLHVSASIGIALYPEFAKTPRQLIQYADTAMYRAKSMGGNCVVKFSSTHQEKLIRAATLENDLPRSIEHSEFFLNFQPIVDSKTGKIDILEVLARWNHPVYGTISPDEFIPIAERTGKINDLGKWILDATCRVCRQILDTDSTVRFAINLSPMQLNNANLAHDIVDCLNTYDLSPKLFDLEITESCVMNDIDCALTQINELGQQGFSLAVDDFGTGHSSLARLSSLPVSKIKLDRLFIAELTNNRDSRIIVRGFIGIARELGISVVAEGVENEHQMMLLRSYGCEYLQGFGILPPCPEEELASLMENGIILTEPEELSLNASA